MTIQKELKSRRQAIRELSLGAAGSMSIATMMGFAKTWGEARAAAPRTLSDADKNRRFVIVLTGSGGASIIDSFLALSESEVDRAGGNSDTTNCFADSQTVRFDDSPFRAVKVDTTIATLGGFPVKTDQSFFVKKHKDDMMVVTTLNSSVNHEASQRRVMNGNGAWDGRTIPEAVAMQYGKGLPVANLNMGAGGYGFAGVYNELPDYARQLSVTDPVYWPLGLHASAGIADIPTTDLIELARDVRDKRLEPQSNFYRTFKDSPAIGQWLNDRNQRLKEFEEVNLIEKLFFTPNKQFNLNPENQRLVEMFPNYHQDRLDAQAILGFLAITKGVSCAVTLGPSFAASGQSLKKIFNPPIAFDFSHTDHRGIQAMMWNRILVVADKLIDLLKQTEFNPATGESFWDRTMLYIASDFGRDQIRPSKTAKFFPSGHHLNNGSVILSPMVKGNTILGGIDPKTALTYGFHTETGAPAKERNTSELELYAGILHSLGIDTNGRLPDMRSFRRKS